MKILKPQVPLVWQDLVEDFLELACFLSPEERSFLLAELAQKNIRANTIDVWPGFLIQDYAVLVGTGLPVKEVWIYKAKQKKIERLRNLAFWTDGAFRGGQNH